MAPTSARDVNQVPWLSLLWSNVQRSWFIFPTPSSPLLLPALLAQPLFSRCKFVWNRKCHGLMGPFAGTIRLGLIDRVYIKSKLDSVQVWAPIVFLLNNNALACKYTSSIVIY